MSGQELTPGGKVRILDTAAKVVVERWPVDAKAMISCGSGRWPTAAELASGKMDEPKADEKAETPPKKAAKASTKAATKPEGGAPEPKV